MPTLVIDPGALQPCGGMRPDEPESKCFKLFSQSKGVLN